MEALVTEQHLAGRLPIGVIHYVYNVIDTLALQNNLLQIQDGLLYDVQDRPTSSYIYQTSTVVAALADSVSAGSIEFIFPVSLQLKNTSEDVSNIEIDFSDGNPVVILTPGAATTVNYSTIGEKVIRFLVRFSDGTQQLSYSYITVTPAISSGDGAARLTSDPSTPCSTTYVKSAIAFQGYEERMAIQGLGEVSTYYANCNDQRLRKPIIILDGFDPMDQRKAPKIYKEDLKYNDINNNEKNLVTEYNSQGYDIIILNFPVYQSGSHPGRIIPSIRIPDYTDGGADYIERNAFVLMRLIDSVNAILVANGSFEKLVIIGPSMGGLISRYALAYMEQHNMPHNTRLWVSFDSPHNGANIPIALSIFYNIITLK